MRIFCGRRKYTSVLWTNMLLIVIILLMIGVMICNFFYESSMQETIEKSLQSVKLLKNEIDNQIAGMEATTRSLRRDYDVLMALAEGGGYRDYKIVSDLSNRTAANVSLVDIVLYDFEKDKVLIASSLNFYDEEMNNAVYHVCADRQSMMDCYLFYAGRLCCHIEKMKEDQSTQLLKEVQSFIEENFADRNLSVQSIADYFHVSTSYLNKYMKKAGEDTVFQMLDKVRMRHAKKMLLEGNAPLKDIVRCCGYGDINHFTKKFKRQTGWTPTQFRLGRTSIPKA